MTNNNFKMPIILIGNSFKYEIEATLKLFFNTARFSFSDSRENAVLVPTKSILTKNDKQVVFLYENGTAKQVEITTGLSDGTVTEVLSGLSGGETVLVKGQDYVTDGSPVKQVGGTNA